MFFRIAIIFFFFLFSFDGKAQKDSVKIDTSYYERYRRKLIITPFWTKSPVAFSIATPNEKQRIRYFDNKPGSIGLRLGFDWLSVGASYKAGFLDPDYRKEKGETKALNLQTSFTARKLLIDVYYQNYKGLYMRADELPPYTEELFYVRPDVNTKMLGVTGKYVFNGKKFSARPPFKFDVWQKRSAGSVMAGFEFISGSAKGDSALVPAAYRAVYPHSGINKMNYLLFGPGVGYGHTFVIKKHFFIMGIGSLNADIGRVKEFEAGFSEASSERWRFDPNFNFRGGIGYNTRDWEIAFGYFTKRLFNTGETNKNRYMAHNDIYKISYTQRINAGKTIPKVVDWAGNIIDKTGFGFLIR